MIETFDLSKVTNVFTEAMDVVNNFQECSIQASFNDVVTFCKVNPQNCQGSTIFDNVTKNMFVLMAQVTSLTQLANEFPAPTAEALFVQTSTVGNVLGTILRVVTGYTQT